MKCSPCDKGLGEDPQYCSRCGSEVQQGATATISISLKNPADGIPVTSQFIKVSLVIMASALLDLAKVFKKSKEQAQTLKMMLELVDILQKEFFQIDPVRLYFTCLSVGGLGTWDRTQRKPDLFAAAVSGCSNVSSSRGKNYGRQNNP